MTKEIRFGAFLREVRAHQNHISFNDLVPEPIIDKDGNKVYQPAPVVKVHPLDVYRLMQPYLTVRIVEQLKSVVPLAVYLMLFQLLILRQGVIDSGVIITGLIAVIIGLMFFMEGLKVGLMPFGKSLGTTLPAKSSLQVVLLIAFLLGIGVTFAEPAISALKAAGQVVKVETSP